LVGGRIKSGWVFGMVWKSSTKRGKKEKTGEMKRKNVTGYVRKAYKGKIIV
jgi:hypothetical protein